MFCRALWFPWDYNTDTLEVYVQRPIDGDLQQYFGDRPIEQCRYQQLVAYRQQGTIFPMLVVRRLKGKKLRDLDEGLLVNPKNFINFTARL